MSLNLVRSLGVGKFLEWGVMSSKCSASGVLVFYNNRVVEIVCMQMVEFSILCLFKNCKDGFVWVFTRVHEPSTGRNREDF